MEPLRGVGPLRPRPDHVGCPVVALDLKIERELQTQVVNVPGFIVPLDLTKSHHLDGQEARHDQWPLHRQNQIDKVLSLYKNISS